MHKEGRRFLRLFCRSEACEKVAREWGAEKVARSRGAWNRGALSCRVMTARQRDALCALQREQKLDERNGSERRMRMKKEERERERREERREGEKNNYHPLSSCERRERACQVVPRAVERNKRRPCYRLLSLYLFPPSLPAPFPTLHFVSLSFPPSSAPSIESNVSAIKVSVETKLPCRYYPALGN